MRSLVRIQDRPSLARRAGAKRAALDSGAQGLVVEDADRPTLLGAIRQVAGGEPYVDPRLAPDFLRQLSKPRPESPLSGREREILQLLADGCSNREISDRLVLS